MNEILKVTNLSVRFDTPEGLFSAVKNISFDINEGKCLGIVGESGSGKTQTFFSITGLLSNNGACDGSALFKGINLLGKDSKKISKLRGKEIGFIFQDPMTSLTPHMKIGNQMIEALVYHEKTSKKEALKKAKDILSIVRMPRIENIMQKYPHELSGGMKQRVMIGISLMCNPSLIIADEPTTALDVTTQKDILNIFNELKLNKNITIALISHDIGVIAEVSDDIMVMNEGKLIEKGSCNQILKEPKKEYTKHLLSCIPEWLN